MSNGTRRYWKVLAVAQSGRLNDVNPVAEYLVVTTTGLEPDDDPLLRASSDWGIKEGRILVFQRKEIPSFDEPSGKVSVEYADTKIWLIEG